MADAVWEKKKMLQRSNDISDGDPLRRPGGAILCLGYSEETGKIFWDERRVGKEREAPRSLSERRCDQMRRREGARISEDTKGKGF
jgi:hypothetical protein